MDTFVEMRCIYYIINFICCRLNLIGGWEGFLQMMSSLKLKPDIKTFTLLLECLPPDLEEEEKLLLSIDSYEVKPDVDFFNILIKRRNFRKESQAAKVCNKLFKHV